MEVGGALILLWVSSPHFFLSPQCFADVLEAQGHLQVWWGREVASGLTRAQTHPHLEHFQKLRLESRYCGSEMCADPAAWGRAASCDQLRPQSWERFRVSTQGPVAVRGSEGELGGWVARWT